MKKILLLTAFIIFTSPIFAQPWLDIMNNNAGTDLNTVRSSFNEYWQGRKEERGTGIKPFKRWEWFWDQRLAPNQPLPKRSIAWEEWSRYQNNSASRTLNTQSAAWTFTSY